MATEEDVSLEGELMAVETVGVLVEADEEDITVGGEAVGYLALVTFQPLEVDPVELSLCNDGVWLSLSEMLHLPLLPAFVTEPSLVLLATEEGRRCSKSSLPLVLGNVATGVPGLGPVPFFLIALIVRARGTKAGLRFIRPFDVPFVSLATTFLLWSLFSSDSLESASSSST